MAYTSGDFLVRAVMTAVTGLPQDLVINDWAFRFEPGSPNIGDVGTLFAAVGDFYSAGASDPAKVGTYIGPWVDRGATHELQAYQIVTGPLGSPFYTEAWLGPSDPLGDPIPLECAGVLSFHGDLTGIPEESGVTHPRARRRGRVYIGPLTDVAINQASAPAFLNDSFTDAMRANANVMGDAAAGADWTWSVWSRKAGTLYPIVAGWTDNAPDTQRRRGTESTSRTVFTR